MVSKHKKGTTRRQFLIGLGTAVAAGMISTGCPRPPAPQADVIATFIPQAIPITNPDSPLWGEAKAVEVELTGQVTIPPFRTTPSVKSIRVRSLHDGKHIAFLLEWLDPQKDSWTIKTEQFADLCAVFLGPHPAPPELWFMGTVEMPVTILQWRAEWQLDIEKGFQDLEVAFPNAAFDYYPPLPPGTGAPVKVQTYPREARIWLPGQHVGNILSRLEKPSPVQKLIAKGPGTVEPQRTQDALGKGVWRNGKWAVALSKRLRATDEGEISLSPGKIYSVAFAVWSGAQQDRGSRKSITKLLRLAIQEA